MRPDGAATRPEGQQTVHFVQPAGADDPNRPSGGNVYDQRVARALVELGWHVEPIMVPGSWPFPEVVAERRLHDRLSAVPTGGVVLADGLVACAAPAPFEKHADRIRTVVLVHQPLADDAGLSQQSAARLTKLEARALRCAARVAATSPWSADRLMRLHGLTGVEVAAPGVDPAPLAAGTDGAHRLLCVAAVTPHKGQHLLVQALARLDSLPWTCDLVGPDDRDAGYAERVGGMITRARLGARLRLRGAWSGAVLAQAYGAADLVILPSQSETYGMVITEALARGIPLVASNAGAVSDTLGLAPDGSRPGLLVPPGDLDGLIGALRSWLTDDQLRQGLRGSARLRRNSLLGWDSTGSTMAVILMAAASGSAVA